MNNQYSMMNEEYRIMNVESVNNIPVLRTYGFYEEHCATNINGALHLRFQTTGMAINDTMTVPRNTLSGNRRICRTAYRSSERKVQRTETLKNITVQVTVQVTAQDTRRLGNTLGDKQTKTNLKKMN